jgi:hypothetical protein
MIRNNPTDTRFCTVEVTAHELSRHAAIAFHTNEGFRSGSYYDQRIDAEFQRLAGLLGYSVHRSVQEAA